MSTAMAPKRMSLSAQKALDYYIGLSQDLNQTCLNESVKTMRAEAQSRLLQLGWPSRRDEDWQYTPITKFIQNEFSIKGTTPFTVEQIKPFLPPFEVTRMIFVDGYFDEALSDDSAGIQRGLVIETTADRFDLAGNENLAETLKIAQSGAFDALNASLVKTGLQIEVAPNIAIEKPLLLLHIQTQPNHVSCLRHNIKLDEFSELSLIQSQVSLIDEKVHSNWVSDIEVGKGAILKQVIVQNEGVQSVAFSHQWVQQAEKSQFETLYVGLGGQIARHQNEVSLRGEWAQTMQNSIVLAKDEQVIDSRPALEHAVPNGESRQLHKFVLKDKARGVFDGMIKVDQDAQKTNAQMDNKNLLLSDIAKMDTKPKLEIYADDVKCSHGAASGKMDLNQLFYMQARGIRKDAAVQMMTEAFLLEPLDGIQNQEIKNWLAASIQPMLKDSVK